MRMKNIFGGVCSHQVEDCGGMRRLVEGGSLCQAKIHESSAKKKKWIELNGTGIFVTDRPIGLWLLA